VGARMRTIAQIVDRADVDPTTNVVRTSPAKPSYRFNATEPPPALAHFKNKSVWCVWKYEIKNDRWTKPPCSWRNGHRGSITDTANWCTFDEAIAAMTRFSLDGIGLVLEAAGCSGVDLDDCITDAGSYTPLAAEAVAYGETYSEVSPSGYGLHFLVEGTAGRTIKRDDLGIELYSHGRYFTITGQQIAEAPAKIRPAPRLICYLARIDAETPKPGREARPNGDAKAVATGEDFWSNVNCAALANLNRWVPALHPTARKQATGGWRVKSKDLGRNLEEDLSYHPQGVSDWGEERGLSPIDAVQRYGAAADAVEAALWLCRQMGLEPAALGWIGKRNQQFTDDPDPESGRQASNIHSVLDESWRSRFAENPDTDLADMEAGPSKRHGSDFEDQMATAFVAKHQEELRYCKELGKTWFQWVGSHWKKNETDLALHYARLIAREHNVIANGMEIKRTTAKAATVAGIEKLARADPAVATTATQWDSDPYLLGTPGGTVDLRTGELRPANPADMISKVTAVAPARMETPIWDRFLREATSGDEERKGDEELIAFIYRLGGYCLTAVVRDHILPFLLGPGGNGKGKLLNTMEGIWGDYAKTASTDLLMGAKGERHPAELADLNGARLVLAQEAEEGKQWSAKRVKQLTGGDTISARFMNCNFFTFRPTHKLLIAINDPPIIRKVDDAMRRRLLEIPFPHKPPVVDPELDQKLRPEWPGILQKFIDGCVEWHKEGLKPPMSVQKATEAYFETQNRFAQWVDECCTVGRNEKDTTENLFGSWKKFADANGIERGTTNDFAGNMQRIGRGITPAKKVDGKRGYKGVSVIQPEAAKDAKTQAAGDDRESYHR
jgi:P4 family phage/plasmid primase-like protien